MSTGYGVAFQRRAMSYEQAMDAKKSVRQEEFTTLVEHLQPRAGEVIVDMPSGGAYLRSFLPPDVWFIAIDEVPIFHAAAQSRLLPGDRSVLAGSMALGLEGASCDGVVSIAGMHHIADRRKSYAEFLRVLRPGGRMIIADVAAGTPQAEFLNGFVDRHSSAGHQGWFLAGCDQQQVVAAGFRDLKAFDARYSWRFISPTQAVDFCLSLFGLDHPDSGNAVMDVLVRDLGFHQTSEEAWSLPWGLRYLVARK